MAPSKMPPEKWQQVRNRWETDERDGFHWVVRAMQLPVSAPAVRKRASTEGWKKRPIKMSKKAAKTALARVTGQKPTAEASDTIEASGVRDLSEFGAFDDLTPKQELFVRAYLSCFDAKTAAIQAGYSERSAAQQGCNLLNEDKIDRAIAASMRDSVQRMGREADELVKFHLAVIEFDPNELAEHRIHACRYCWSTNHAYQHSPSTWQREREKFQKRWQKMSESEQKLLGDFPEVPPDGWYDAKRGPNDDCPECHGVGVAVVKWKDTRHLSPIGKMLFAGVKESKEGLEVVTLQKQKSLDILSAHLGLTKVAEQQVSVAIVTETAQKFTAIMEAARQRQQAVLAERGLIERTDQS